ncbi:hypothetical protein HETIRDRAFT_224201, partial [Heterobasidion irregulare TC 32-1]
MDDTHSSGGRSKARKTYSGRAKAKKERVLQAYRVSFIHSRELRGLSAARESESDTNANEDEDAAAMPPPPSPQKETTSTKVNANS